MSNTTGAAVMEAPASPEWFDLDDDVTDVEPSGHDLSSVWLLPDPVEQIISDSQALEPRDLSRAIGELMAHITDVLGGFDHEITLLSGGEFLATEPFTGMFGTGSTISDAQEDLRIVLYDYKDSLLEHRESLGSNLVSHYEHLEAILNT